MKKRTAVLIGLLGLGSTVQAWDWWHKFTLSLGRKGAVQEWKNLIDQPDVNYQVALKKFAQFDSIYHATDAEREHFRNWKKSVRWHATPDGLIFDPEAYVRELEVFRAQARLPQPNTDEMPMVYPAPAPAIGERIAPSLPNPNSLGYWISAGYRGTPDVAGGATGNGAGTGLAFDPTRPNVVYACVRNAGLWKSENYGKSHVPLTDHFESPYCDGVGVGTDRPQVIYLLQSGKVWYSEYGGIYWENRSAGFSGGADEVHVDPLNAERALIAGDQGLFLTTDGGRAWTKVLSGTFREIETTPDWSTLGVAKDAGNPNASFYLSVDQGATWTETVVSNERTGLNRLYLGFHPRANPDSLIVYAYLLKSSNTPTRFYGLFRSADRGRTFSEVKAPGYTYPNGLVPVSGDSIKGYTELGDGYGGVNPYTTSSWVGEFWVSPANPDHLITMREKLWYSTNGGQTWNYGPSYGEAGWADRRFATSNPTKDTLWIADDGGFGAVALADLFPWQGNGSKYIYKNGTIAASEGTNLGISAYNKDVFLTGGQDAGQVFQRNGKSSHVHKVDVYRGQISPYNDSLYWTAALIHKLTDSTSVSLSNQVEPDRVDPWRVYGFDGNGVLYRTQKGQNAWDFSDRKSEANASTTGVNHSTAFAEIVDLSSTGVSSWNAWTFEQSRANPERAYIGDEKGKRLFVTDNLSAAQPTWTQLTQAPALGRYRIATHPHNPNLVAVAGDKAAWISRDGGISWSELTGYPASGTIGLLFDPNTTEGLYAANAMTVWYRDESMSAWTEFNRGLPLQQIVEMKMAHYADGESRLWVAKYGRGAWSTPLLSSWRKKPIRADFAVHSLGKKTVYDTGDSLWLYDLGSGEIQSRTWTVTGPSGIQVRTEVQQPKFLLDQPGLYSVRYKVAGPNGATDSLERRGWIQVQAKVRPIDSTPAQQNGGAWYLGIGSVVVNGSSHGSSGNTNLFYEDLTHLTAFRVLATDSVRVQINPSYNDGTWGVSHAKVYVDLNNSGSYDSTELVYASAGTRQGHSFAFVAPAAAVVDQPLRMRVIANRTKTIPNAYASQYDQGQMEDHVIVLGSAPASVQVQATALGKDGLDLQGSSAQTTQVVDQGFVYAAFKSKPDLSDPGRISTTSSGSNFAATVKGLPRGRTYYVRAYVIDQKGSWLSPVDTVQLPAYTMPTLESLAPTWDSAQGHWVARARLDAQGNAVDSLALEWGVQGDLSSTIRLGSQPRSGWDSVQAILGKVPRGTQVRYRLRADVGGERYYSAVQAFASERDLYAHWSFDDSGSTALDRSGNGRHATLGSGMDRDSDSRGGQALRFDSTADVATLGLANLRQPFTVTLRVQRAKNSPIGSASILNGSNRRLDLEGWNNTRRVALQAQGLYDRTTSYTTPLGAWTELALTVTGDSARLYVNRNYHSSYATTSYELPLTSLGKSGSSMLGLLDEVKVYQRALNPTEIAQTALLYPVLRFDSLTAVQQGAPEFVLQASSTLGRIPRFEISSGAGIIALDQNKVSPLQVGTARIRAIVDGDSIYAADTVERSLVVLPREETTPTISTPSSKNWQMRVWGNKITLSYTQDLRQGQVHLLDAAGKVLSQGPLVQTQSNTWEYTWELGSSSRLQQILTTSYVLFDLVEANGQQIQRRFKLESKP